MGRRRLRTFRARPLTAMFAAVAVIVLHASLLMALASDPSPLPPRLTLLELLWAAARRPSFDLLTANLVAAPVLSYLAWTVRGRHRRALAMSWIVFITLMIYPFGERLLIMLRVIEHVATH